MTTERLSPEGTEWRLTACNDADGAPAEVPAGIVATAVLADGIVAGSTGCNRYHAPFRLDGDAIDARPTAMTPAAE